MTTFNEAAAVIDGVRKRYFISAESANELDQVPPNKVVTHWVGLGCPSGFVRDAAIAAATEALAVVRRALSDAKYWDYSGRRWGGVYQQAGNAKLAAERVTYAANEARVREAEADLASVTAAVDILGLTVTPRFRLRA